MYDVEYVSRDTGRVAKTIAKDTREEIQHSSNIAYGTYVDIIEIVIQLQGCIVI